MTRNWDLIRQILIHIEQLPDFETPVFANHFNGYDEQTVNYHLWLLIQSGLIVGVCNSDTPKAGLFCKACCLTWQGHEFLASVQQDTIWHKIKTMAKEQSLTLSFEVVRHIALKLM
ncbi:DUF2513 domain-containing protein [Moraxella sp. ZY210820]|uniref:DUF2513 domain-containing protein n=1 Tax=Moraxella sp. ZY210820 TaxID=2904123 RepID=UPI002730E489|nr:DUF2513 domain-containing protein [Moraxella sp. ZY210820]WLF84848.1 DUF2513 domain-containing protein [Moraxella sp. ZY210820]